MLYVCIYNEDLKEIQYAEELPTDTPEQKEWAYKYGIERLDGECRGRGDAAGWRPYASEEKQFSFPKVAKK